MNTNLTFLLSPNGENKYLSEGDAIESNPPGLILKQLHGQLALYKKNPLGNESSILWQSRTTYVDDGSGIGSFAVFQSDCNLIIYSDVYYRPNAPKDESIIWFTNTPCWCNCFLAWDHTNEEIGIYKGNMGIQTEKLWSLPKRTDRNPNGFIVLLREYEKLMQGFMIKAEPSESNLFLQHDRGNLHLYQGMPSKSTSTLLWKTEDAYTYDGDSDVGTFTNLQVDGNLIVFGFDFKESNFKHALWASGSSGEHRDYFLAWLPDEQRLAIFSGNPALPESEIWTSQNFFWERANPNLYVWAQILVSSLTRFTSVCSIMGSGLIICILLSKWKKNRKTSSTRDRLLIGMSFLDILASIANVFDISAIPTNTTGIVGAVGNTTTCTIQGFFVQIGFGVPLYNCMLCLYVMIIVRIKWTDDFIASYVEPFMHIIALGYSLTAATIGVVLELYNSNGSFCWIEMYPHDCEDMGHVKCTRGINAKFYQWVFGGVVLIISFIVIITSMSIIYYYIRSNVKKMKSRYGDESVANSRQLQEVGKQAFLYVASFAITFIWPMAAAIERQIGITPPIWQNALLSFFFTFQGFWNFLIFIRPMYNQTRRRNKEKNCFWVLKEAVIKEATAIKPSRSRSGRRSSQFRLSSVRSNSSGSGGGGASATGRGGEAKDEE